MAIKPVQMLVSPGMYYCKCPYAMTPTRIVVHNTANDASARNEISYMRSNYDYTSYHFAVDDKEVVQGVPLNRNAWHAGDGNGAGNRKGIGIEICYSLSGGSRFIAAEKLAAKFIAQLLKERGWGINKVTKHQDYMDKYCPHRTLDMGWQRFLNMVSAELKGKSASFASGSTKKTSTTKTTTAKDTKVNVTYCVMTQKHGKLPAVKNLEDYAGYQDSPITGIAIKVDKGTVEYRAHIKGGGWLPWVTGYSWSDHVNGYAGNGKPIDAVEIYYNTPESIRPFKRAKYRVAPVGGGYYDWQYDSETTGNQDGYAGCIGKAIGKLQIEIV